MAESNNDNRNNKLAALAFNTEKPKSKLPDKSAWNFTSSSDAKYVCFLKIGTTNYNVLEFTLTSSTSNFFKIEILFLSSNELTFNSLEKKSAVLSMFYDSTIKQYKKSYKAYIRKFYIQGESYVLSSTPPAGTPTKNYVYKVELYPDLYELTLKTRNYIYISEKENTKINVAKSILTDNYSISLKDDAIVTDQLSLDSITQYQETDFAFVVRMFEESDVILFYDLSSEIPSLKIVRNSQSLTTVTSIYSIIKPTDVKGSYQQDELIAISIDQDYAFNAKLSSCKVHAGSIFYIANNPTEYYFVTHNVLKFTQEGSQWQTVNEVSGFVINKAESYLINTQEKPVISGILRGIIVSDTENSFHVNEKGEVRVRLLWHNKSDDDDSKFLSSASAVEEKITFESWDLNKDESDVTKWIPVTQWGSSGDQFGNYNLPRAGQEVVVWFYKGDPDRPIVMGSVYTSSNSFPNSFIGSVEEFKKAKDEAVDSAKSEVTLKDIVSDFPIVAPTIAAAAANVGFKHYSYNDNGETDKSRANELSMFNNLYEEKIHMISPNLLNLRSGNNIHIKADSLYRGVYGNKKETINDKYDVYVFGDDTYTIMDADRTNYYLSLTSQRSGLQSKVTAGLDKVTDGVSGMAVGQQSNNVTEVQMLSTKTGKTETTKKLLASYISGGTFVMSIYDLSVCANMFFAGAMINMLLIGNISNICALGIFEIYANMIKFTTIGKCGITVGGSYSLSVYGMGSEGFKGRYSKSVAGLSSLSFGSMKLKSGNTDIKLGKTKIETGEADIKTAKLKFMAADSALTFAKCSAKTGNFDLTSLKISIKCSDFSLVTTKFSVTCGSQISFVSPIFKVQGLMVTLKGALIQLG